MGFLHSDCVTAANSVLITWVTGAWKFTFMNLLVRGISSVPDHASKYWPCSHLNGYLRTTILGSPPFCCTKLDLWRKMNHLVKWNLQLRSYNFSSSSSVWEKLWCSPSFPFSRFDKRKFTRSVRPYWWCFTKEEATIEVNVIWYEDLLSDLWVLMLPAVILKCAWVTSKSALTWVSWVVLVYVRWELCQLVEGTNSCGD